MGDSGGVPGGPKRNRILLKFYDIYVITSIIFFKKMWASRDVILAPVLEGKAENDGAKRRPTKGKK
jgi:hypothetical protein